MKKSLVIVTAIILFIAIVIGIIFLIPSKKETEDTINLSKVNASDFIKELEEKKIDYTKLDDSSYVIPSQSFFDSETDIFVYTKKEVISEITANYSIFSNEDYSGDLGIVLDDEDAGQDGSAEEQETEGKKEEYRYSSNDKKKIKKEIESLRKCFETKLGCGELTRYSLTPFVETEGLDIPEDDLEKVLLGYYQMEYSVRDKDGRLWFLWIYSPYTGVMEASITMIDSPDDYQDFEPIINMQQQSNTQTEGE